MKYGAFSLACVAVFVASAAATCVEIGGNWYCDETKGVTYANFGKPGTYQKVTYMSQGECKASTETFSGGVSPLDQDISWHFRGPLHLKQFAYYTADGSLEQEVPATEERSSKQRQHKAVHDSNHKNQRISAASKNLSDAYQQGKTVQHNSAPAMITATVNGQNVSSPASATRVPHAPWNSTRTPWNSTLTPYNSTVASWNSTVTPCNSTVASCNSTLTSSPMPPMITSNTTGQAVSWSAFNSSARISTVKSLVTVTTTKRPSPATTTTPTSLGPDVRKWNQKAYYNAKDQVAENVVFLNNRGGQGSGVFDLTWGASLSYASSDGKGASASPQILADALLEDNNEFAIFSTRPCNNTDADTNEEGDEEGDEEGEGNGTCGTFRPDTVAYHGFDGLSKLFLLEFTMPLSDLRDQSLAPDTPAVWILNAQIPRTMQYGPIECSCWATGCGEWDIFEVLNAGNTRCKSTYHGGAGRSIGDSNWFARPVDQPVKIAVLLDGAAGQGSIVTLPDDVVFGQEIADEVLRGWVANFSGDASGNGDTIIIPG